MPARLGAPRPSTETVAGSIEEKLVSLKLSASDPEESRRIDRVLNILCDVVSGPNFMICSGDQEALWWEAFAEVFQTEVEVQTAECGGKAPSSADKRQILADILVWAEVTQEHYDSSAFRFVTEPHESDRSFQRIGRSLASIKASKGLGGGRGAPAASSPSGLGGVSSAVAGADDVSSNAGARLAAGRQPEAACG